MTQVSRPLISGVAAACFALSVFTWGTMPGCAAPAHSASAHAHHAEHLSHVVSEPSTVPEKAQCFVHLCCVLVAASTLATQATARLSSPERAYGLTASDNFVLVRPAHTLPFAHAPPSRFI